MKTYADSNLEKNLSSELLNMDKTYYFVIKLLKKSPPGNQGKYTFFLEIEIVTTKIINSKSLEKICRQLLSTMNVLKKEGNQDLSRKSSECKIYVVLNKNIKRKLSPLIDCI